MDNINYIGASNNGLANVLRFFLLRVSSALLLAKDKNRQPARSHNICYRESVADTSNCGNKSVRRSDTINNFPTNCEDL